MLCDVPYFQGLYISQIFLISNIKEVIFKNFCYGQYLCNTFKAFQGFIFHEFGLYHEILEI